MKVTRLLLFFCHPERGGKTGFYFSLLAALQVDFSLFIFFGKKQEIEFISCFIYYNLSKIKTYKLETQTDAQPGNAWAASGITDAMYKGLDYIGEPDPFSSISNLIQLSEKMLDQTTLEYDTDLIKHEDDDNSDSV